MNIHVFGNEFSLRSEGNNLRIVNKFLGKSFLCYTQEMPKTPEHAISLVEDFSEYLL